jgi:hypothetical protein
VSRRKRGEPWPCTAADIERERDERGLSWAQVANNLGLGNPSAARKAYAELTGRPHDSSQPTVTRAPKGAARQRTVTPLWDDDSDQEEIEAALNGPWVEESGEGKDYRPAHWQGSAVKVRRRLGDLEWDEELKVSRTEAFTYGPDGDQPLQVTVYAVEGGARTFRVSDFLAVG